MTEPGGNVCCSSPTVKLEQLMKKNEIPCCMKWCLSTKNIFSHLGREIKEKDIAEIFKLLKVQKNVSQLQCLTWDSFSLESVPLSWTYS